jgi:hypothetical protein
MMLGIVSGLRLGGRMHRYMDIGLYFCSQLFIDRLLTSLATWFQFIGRGPSTRGRLLCGMRRSRLAWRTWINLAIYSSGFSSRDYLCLPCLRSWNNRQFILPGVFRMCRKRCTKALSRLLRTRIFES